MLNVKIHDLAKNEPWLAKLSVMLHDSRMTDLPRFDPEGHRFSFGLHRIGYEYREERRVLFRLVKRFRMPSVPGTLEFNGVTGFRTNDPKVLDNVTPFNLTAIILKTQHELECWTDIGKIHLTIPALASLSYKDTGDPVQHPSTFDFGCLIVRPDLIDEFAESVDV